MINSDAFAKRLEKVIDFYSETASSFAENIGVQRSSISHILSGRNKPSLDFVLKVLSFYPEVELYWLLNGKGTFPSAPPTEAKIIPQNDNVSFEKNSVATSPQNLHEDKSIERIVIFYKDGTFSNYEQS